MNRDLDELHEVLLELTGLFNRPQPDALLLKRAGISLDRALFPILSRIGSRGPVTIDEVAEMSGRDQSTVSRQVTKLEQAGLVTRRIGEQDHRRREVMTTDRGRQLLSAIGEARRGILETVFREWSEDERQQMIGSLRRFVASARSSLTKFAVEEKLPGEDQDDRPHQY